MVSVLTLSAVDCGFEPQSCQTKDYKIGICCFSAKENEQRLAQNQDNVYEWSDMSISRLLFQSASTIKIKLRVGLVQSGTRHHLIEN